MLTAEIVEPGSDRWTDTLAGMRHDLYHLPGYASFSASHEEVGEPIAVIAQDDEDTLLLPLVVREIPPELTDGRSGRDAISPKFYPGPILSDIEPERIEAFTSRALAAAKDVLREHHVVSAFVRMHPLLTPSLKAFASAGKVVDMGDSISVDLHLTEEELWHQTRHNHRRDINKSRRTGYRFDIDPEWSRLDDFVECYRQSMLRLDAHPSWHLPKSYFEALREQVGDHVLMGTVELDGEVASAALLTRVGDLAEYHLGGTMDAHLPARPSKLLIHEAILWARDLGLAVFHLAGTVRRGDSLEHFKLGFSPLTHTVNGWHVVTDEQRYEELTVRWAEVHAMPAHPPDGFFPAYRRQPAPRAAGGDDPGTGGR